MCTDRFNSKITRYGPFIARIITGVWTNNVDFELLRVFWGERNHCKLGASNYYYGSGSGCLYNIMQIEVVKMKNCSQKAQKAQRDGTMIK